MTYSNLFEFFALQIEYHIYRMGGSEGIALDAYSAYAWYQPRLRQPLSWVRCFVIFLNTCRQITVMAASFKILSSSSVTSSSDAV
jgi:hypothetical protein